MLSLARCPLTYLARLAVGLCIFSGTAAAGEFCALSVSISTHDGRPARLTPVLLMDSSGKRVFDEQADGSELRICDFGFGPHKLVIGYGFCYPVTISNIVLRPGRPIHLAVRLNECPADVWRGSCSAYFRVRNSKGQPLDRVRVTSDGNPTPIMTDQFGRVEVFVLKGKPSVITFSRTGYSALQLSLTCPSAEEIDREIVLTPDER